MKNKGRAKKARPLSKSEKERVVMAASTALSHQKDLH